MMIGFILRNCSSTRQKCAVCQSRLVPWHVILDHSVFLHITNMNCGAISLVLNQLNIIVSTLYGFFIIILNLLFLYKIVLCLSVHYYIGEMCPRILTNIFRDYKFTVLYNFVCVCSTVHYYIGEMCSRILTIIFRDYRFTVLYNFVCFVFDSSLLHW